MIISGQRDLELRIGLLDNLDRLTHRLHRTLVHRDGGFLEPTFLAKVAGEIF